MCWSCLRTLSNAQANHTLRFLSGFPRGVTQVRAVVYRISSKEVTCPQENLIPLLFSLFLFMSPFRWLQRNGLVLFLEFILASSSSYIEHPPNLP